MAKILKDVNETIGLNEIVSGILTPVRCRNCKRELTLRADFEYCNDCRVYYVGKWRICSSSP
jgi:hypothetical protein